MMSRCDGAFTNRATDSRAASYASVAFALQTRIRAAWVFGCQASGQWQIIMGFTIKA